MRSTLARLSTVRRHHALKVIGEREVQSREFSDWHMGLASGQPVSEPVLTVGRDALTGFVNGL